MELELILQRLKDVMSVNNDSSLAVALDFHRTQVGSWKRNGGIPYQACLRAAQKTGYTMEWLITGEGPKKHGDPLPFNIDQENTIQTFIDVLVDCVEFRVVDKGQNWDDKTIDMMGRKFYNKFTGVATIPKAQDINKTA